MSHLTLGTALRLGLKALLRQAWLAAVGLGVTLLRRALAWPAYLVGALLVLRGAVDAARLAPLSAAAPPERLKAERATFDPARPQPAPPPIRPETSPGSGKRPVSRLE